MKRKLTLFATFFLALLFNIQSSSAADYYWIGNSGDWSDLNHWATTSGGSTLHTTLPGDDDNVIFDENSFDSPNHVVTFGLITAVTDFIAMDLDEDVTFSPSASSFDVQGSFKVNDRAIFDVDFFFLSLEAADLDNELFIGKGFLNADKTGTISIAGSGSYLLQSDLEISTFSVFEGTITTGDHLIKCNTLETSSSNEKHLNFDNTQFEVSDWDLRDLPTTFSMNNTSLSILKTFYGGDQIYDKVVFLTPDSNSFTDYIIIEGDNTVDSLIIESNVEMLFEQTSNQTITSAIVVNGLIDNEVSFFTIEGEGSASISGTDISVTGDYPIFKNVSYVGTANFNLTNGLILENSSGWEVSSVTMPTGNGSFYFHQVYADSAFIFAGAKDGNERLIFMREGSGFVDVNIVQNTFYTADSQFGQGSNVGTDSYLVYQGEEGFFKVTGLQPETTYGIAIVEANVNHDRTVVSYDKVTSSFSKSTETTESDAIYMQNGTFTINTGDTFYDDGGRGSFNPGKNQTITFNSAEAGKAINLEFETLLDLDNFELKIYDGTDTLGTPFTTLTGDSQSLPLNVAGTSESLTVNFKTSDFTISELNPRGWTANISLVVPKPDQLSSNVNVTAEMDNQIDFSFTKGNGDGRLIIVKGGTDEVLHTPIKDSIYLADNNFQSGTDLGNNEFVVGFGDISSLSLASISSNSIYSLAIFEYNQIGDEIVYSENSYNFTVNNILEAPTVTVSNVEEVAITDSTLQLSFTAGNGVGRMVIIGLASEPSPSSVGNIAYVANPEFGTGHQFDNYSVVGFGDITNLTITNLPSKEPYHVLFYEYNQNGDVYSYLQPVDIYTFDNSIDPPTTSANDLVIQEVMDNSVSFSITPGDGDGRIFIAKEGSNNVFFRPQDDSTYEADAQFGNTVNLGDNEYVIGYGDITSVNLTNLIKDTDYSVVVFEYNQDGSDISYANNPYRFTVSTKVIPPPADFSEPFQLTFDRISTGLISQNSIQLFPIFQTENEYPLDLLVLASDSPIDLADLESTLIDDVRVDVNGTFGEGTEVIEGVFAIGKNTLFSNSSRTEYQFDNFQPNTDYYFAFVAFRENLTGSRYGFDGAVVQSYRTKKANAVILGAESEITVSELKNLYSSNGYSNRGYANGETIFRPANANEKMTIVFQNLTPLFNGPIRVYDGLPTEENLIVEQTDYIPEITDFMEITATNSEGILTVQENGGNTFSTSSALIGFKALLYAKGDNGTTKPSPVGNLNFTEINKNSASVNLNRGNGEQIIALLNESRFAPFPVFDGIDLENDTIPSFNNRVVYKGTGTNFTFGNLTAGKSYTLRVFEVKGTGSNITYSNEVSKEFSTVDNRPTVSASDLSFENLEENNVRLKWKNGNGERRVVVGFNFGSYGERLSDVLDGMEYAADNDLLTTTRYRDRDFEYFILYDGISDSVDVLNLGGANNDEYDFQVLEYNSSGINRNYLDSETAEFGLKPTVPESGPMNLEISDITTSSAQLSWQYGPVFYDRHFIYVSTVDEPIPVSEGELEGVFRTENGFVVSVSAFTDFSLRYLSDDTQYFVKIYAYNEIAGFYVLNTTDFVADSFTTNKTTEYYWVGGTGEWTDINHWATTSGGSVQPDTIPSSEDNIIIDQNSNAGQTDVFIFARENFRYSINSIITDNLATSFTFSGDSIDQFNGSATLSVNGTLSDSDSLEFNFGFYEIRPTIEEKKINFNIKDSPLDPSIFLDGRRNNRLKAVVEKLPSKTIDLYASYSDVSFDPSIDTISVRRFSVFETNLENVPSLTDVSEVQLFTDVPYISTSDADFFEVRGYLRVGEIAINARNLILSQKTVFSTDKITKPDDQPLRISSTSTGVESFITTEADSLVIVNAEITDNHALGDAKFIAKNSILFGNVEGWTLDGEKDPETPNSAPSPFIDFGDSTRIVLTYRRDSRNFGKVLALVQEGSFVSSGPEDNTFYSSTGDLNQADKIGDAYVFDMEDNLSIEITGLNPDTEYSVSLHNYVEGNEKVSYSTARFNRTFITARTNDSFFEKGQTRSMVANGQTLYWGDGVGHNPDNSRDHNNSIMIIAPSETEGKVAIQFNTLDYHFQFISIFNGSSTNAELIRTIGTFDYFNENFSDLSELFTSTSDDGHLTLKFEQIFSYGGSYKGPISFNTYTVDATLSPEPEAITELMVSDTLDSEVTLSWTKPENAKTLILASNSQPTINPTDFISYEADSSFGEGDELGNGFVVYSGEGTEVTLTGLKGRTQYFFTAYSFLESEGQAPNYRQADSAAVTVVTKLGVPESNVSVTVDQVNISGSIVNLFITSQGEGVLGLLKEAEPITAIPDNNVFYFADNNFSGNGDGLSDGSKAIFNNNSVFTWSLSTYGLKENTTYYYKFFNYSADGNIILYNPLPDSGFFKTKNGTFEIAGQNNATVCRGSEFSFSYFYNGNERAGQKARPIISQFENLTDSTVLEVIDSTSNEMTVQIPASFENGTYYISLVPEEGDFLVETTLINIAESEAPSITRNDLELYSSDDENILWYLNGEQISGAFNDTLTLTTSGVYQVVKLFGNCEYTSEEFIVLPAITFSESNNTEEYCNGSSFSLQFDRFGDLTDKDFTIDLAAVADSIYDQTATFTELNLDENTLTGVLPGDLVPGEFYLRLTENTTGVDANIIKILVTELEAVQISQTDNVLSSNYDEGNQWYQDGEIIPGATEKTFTVIRSGEYFVSVMVNDCEITSETVTLSITSTISDLENELKVYPNPSRELLMITFPNDHSGNFELNIISMDGKSVLSISGPANANAEMQIDISNLTKGVFVLQLTSNGTTKAKRIVKH
ncbi:MAG: T9SS type A sorting domain-containing protein [Bacteroidota bacterium]